MKDLTKTLDPDCPVIVYHTSNISQNSRLVQATTYPVQSHKEGGGGGSVVVGSVNTYSKSIEKKRIITRIRGSST